MRYFLAITQILVLAALVGAQAPQPTRSHELNQSVASLFAQGKYDEAISTAEEIVAIERKVPGTKNLVHALENLAHIRTTRFKRSLAELYGGIADPALTRETVARLRGDAAMAETDLREAIRVADAMPSALHEQRIAMRNSLAWLLYNYQPPDVESSIGFDKLERDKFEMRTRARFYKRIDEAESLFKEALKITSANSDANDPASLITSYNYGEFALATGDLENALARFEKSVSDVEKLFGNKSVSLVQPIEAYIKTLTATGQDDLAFEMVSRLVRVTGKSAAMPNTLVNITLRADKAFAPTNSSGIEANARANKERATLSGRAATFNAGFDAMLAVSTHGKQYYDATGPANVRRVPVRVLVDESGKVVEATALAGDKETKSDAETAVRGWKFKPLVAAGQPRKLRGYVECILLTNQLSQ